MIDLQTLSKQKYIYRVYETYERKLYCDKHPIIYINSKVVYFKSSRKAERLTCINANEVNDNFVHYAQKHLLDRFGGSIDAYFWDVDSNIAELYPKFKQQRELIRLQNAEAKIIANYEKAKREYEDAQKELEKLNAIKENIK